MKFVGVQKMDQQKRIVHVATSYDGDIAAVAEFEHNVQIWNIRTVQRLSSFETTMDFGGTRLAINQSGTICFAGAYERQGIAAYDAQTGEELWRRKDLKKVQKLRASLDGGRLFCGFESRDFLILDESDGQSLEAISGAVDVWESPYESVVTVVQRGRDYSVRNLENVPFLTLSRTTFAALDFAYGPQSLCISECTGAVTCFDVSSGKTRWKFDPGEGIHVLKLSYIESQHKYAAITRRYEESGDLLLHTIDAETGMATEIASVNGCSSFCYKGSHVLTPDGNLHNTSTYDIESSISFFL